MKWKAKICWAIPFHKYENMRQYGYKVVNFLNLLRAFNIKAAKDSSVHYSPFDEYNICKRCGHIIPYNYTIS